MSEDELVDKAEVDKRDVYRKLAEGNQFRYRGYIYDEETGFYYLNSRYYDPETGRFISPDDLSSLDKNSINGLNLYAYCNNNPVMNFDPDGQAPKWWQSILIGMGVIVAATLISTAITFSGGGALAFLATAGKVILGGLKIAAVTGLTSGIIRAGTSIFNGSTLNEIGKSFVIGFADGFLAGSLYASGSMILGSLAYKISGNFNNGYGISNGSWQFGYQTPKTPGITIFTFAGGINGGSSIRLDIDIFNGLHLHYKFAEKLNNKIMKKIFGGMKRHRWIFAPIIIGLGIGFSEPFSEW